jgi:hypothetical protein
MRSDAISAITLGRLQGSPNDVLDALYPHFQSPSSGLLALFVKALGDILGQVW